MQGCSNVLSNEKFHTYMCHVPSRKKERLPQTEKALNFLVRAENNGQQVAGHDDRPNIF